MPEFCLKKEIEKKLPTNDRFTIALILLCCNFCKKVHEKSEIDKYSKYFGKKSIEKTDKKMQKILNNDLYF